MVSLGLIALGLLILGLLGLGSVLVFRVEAAIAFQRRYAEALSSAPPSDAPEFYEETHDHRTAVFRLGGAVILVVGISLLALVAYGAFFVESFGSRI